MVPYRERKQSSGSEEFEKWEADAHASIVGCGLADDEKVEFLFSKLEGGVAVDGLSAALSEVFSKRELVHMQILNFLTVTRTLIYLSS